MTPLGTRLRTNWLAIVPTLFVPPWRDDRWNS